LPLLFYIAEMHTVPVNKEGSHVVLMLEGPQALQRIASLSVPSFVNGKHSNTSPRMNMRFRRGKLGKELHKLESSAPIFFESSPRHLLQDGGTILKLQ
jgi:hypothetical protein